MGNVEAKDVKRERRLGDVRRCEKCGADGANSRRRWLCVSCFDATKPREKQRHPLVTPPNPKRAPGLGLTRGRLPAAPTDTAPGTVEREAVMLARLACGENPRHPQDAHFDADGVFRWCDMDGVWHRDPHAHLVEVGRRGTGDVLFFTLRRTPAA